MQSQMRPGAEWELATLLAEATRKHTPIEIIGGSTKRTIGRPVQAAVAITTSGLRGIPLYEPTELVMSAMAGTPLSEVEAELNVRGQMLPFEPIDLGPVLGMPARSGSIGAVFATNMSGSRRIQAGAARDHLIGLRAVTGRGEIFKSGGRVMKNVTGYDVARGWTGSWGTLAVATEVTFKVVPRVEETNTLVLLGLTDEIAAEAMCAALGTPFDVSGTVHLQAPLTSRLEGTFMKAVGKSATAIRLEAFSRFIGARVEKLRKVLSPFGDMHLLGNEVSLAFWAEVAQLSPFQSTSSALWRISVPPKQGAKLVESVSRRMPVTALYDWSGGLVWLEVPGAADAGATDIRRAVARVSGHATLIRAEPSVRAVIDVFQPLDEGLAAITRKLKATFDPAGILNPGRMYAAI